MMGAGIILNIQTAGNLKLQTNGACTTLTDLDKKKQSDNHVMSFSSYFCSALINCNCKTHVNNAIRDIRFTGNVMKEETYVIVQ